MEKKSKAASEFNTYVKSNFEFHFSLICLELGLYEKHVQEKYLGTIFTKQQTGFNPDSFLHKGKDMKLKSPQI